MTEQLKWIYDAHQQYIPQNGVGELQTNIQRGNYAVRFLKDVILPSTDSKLNILVVGVGLDSPPVSNPYEIYRIAGAIEKAKRDYRLVVVDNDSAPLNDLKHRKNIYLSMFDEEQRPNDTVAWNEYCTDTAQTDEIVHEMSEDLVFDHDSSSYTQEWLQHGFRKAKIPKHFEKKLRWGRDVSLIHSDIAVASLAPDSIDFISCMYVLYQLTMQGQILTLANMAKALKKDGRILLSDLADKGNPLFQEFGGWLSDDLLDQLGLVHDRRYKNDREEIIEVLTKK